jgi:hypothetical protein
VAQRRREINALRVRSAVLYFYASGSRPLEYRFDVVECRHWQGLLGAVTRERDTLKGGEEKALLVIKAQE